MTPPPSHSHQPLVIDTQPGFTPVVPLHLELDAAAMVEDPGERTVGKTTRAGVGRVDVDQGLRVQLADRGQVVELRVDAVLGVGGEKVERVADRHPRQRRPATRPAGGSGGRRSAPQRPGSLLREELDLARWCREEVVRPGHLLVSGSQHRSVAQTLQRELGERLQTAPQVLLDGGVGGLGERAADLVHVEPQAAAPGGGRSRTRASPRPVAR